MGYCGYEFATTKEDSVVDGTSKVDYVALVDNEPRALCEAKSPWVMKRAGEYLPPHGIELNWVKGQSLVPKILAEVSTPISVGYNVDFKEICVGRIVSWSETYGMAIYYLP